MRKVCLAWLSMALGACSITDGPPYSISGSATLPDCSDTPEMDLSGLWFDQGIVTITSAGCEEEGAPLGAMFGSCTLNWEFEQDGNDMRILVDEEYAMKGRMCGDTLHLEGGWWLPLENENGQCDYDDDDGAEVGIEMGASALALEDVPGGGSILSGTLALRADCSADYVVELQRIR